MGSVSPRMGFAYGFVRGTSMWPALVPGDLLRAERVTPRDLTPGDILVFTGAGDDPVVHRLIRVDGADGGDLLLRTAGDRSGPDDAAIRTAPHEELFRLAGVLRLGRWRRPSGKKWFGSRLCPARLVALHCRIVRRLGWGAPSGLTAGRGESSNRREG